jgi:hypothetical protein
MGATSRPTSFWLAALRRRAAHQHGDLALDEPVQFESEEQRRAAIKFFNAAFRAEESGLRQAHELAGEVERIDPDLAEVLRLYGAEEGWHRELLEGLLTRIGGGIQPMGTVTSLLYRVYARAERMETIVLVNLMFETIGATTYRMALRNVRHGALRRMLTVLTRDESFHVPLNVHFLSLVLAQNPAALRRLRIIYQLLFASLVLLPLASRPKAKAFDGIPTLALSRAYAEQLARLFLHEPELGLEPPRLVLALLGLERSELSRRGAPITLAEGIDGAVDREDVIVDAM